MFFIMLLLLWYCVTHKHGLSSTIHSVESEEIVFYEFLQGWLLGVAGAFIFVKSTPQI